MVKYEEQKKAWDTAATEFKTLAAEKMAKEKIREEKEAKRAAQAAYDELERMVNKLNQREEQILARLEELGKLKLKDKKKIQENQNDMRKLVQELNALRQEKG